MERTKHVKIEELLWLQVKSIATLEGKEMKEKIAEIFKAEIEKYNHQAQQGQNPQAKG